MFQRNVAYYRTVTLRCINYRCLDVTVFSLVLASHNRNHEPISFVVKAIVNLDLPHAGNFAFISGRDITQNGQSDAGNLVTY